MLPQLLIFWLSHHCLQWHHKGPVARICCFGKYRSKGWWTFIITVWVEQQHRDTVRDTGRVDSTAMIGPSCLLAGKQWFLSGLCFHETIKIAEATYSTSHTCMHYALDCTNWAEPVCLQCICWLKAKRCVARGVNRGMSASFATHFSLCLLCLRK